MAETGNNPANNISLTPMNYLAHAYLSFNKPDILAGNMISDYIKGKKQFDYPLPVQAGIQLHRGIDNFTDMHPATRELRSFFRPHYRLYAGAFADVSYDHFLAIDKNEFSSAGILDSFARDTYARLEPYQDIFPAYFRAIFPYMKAQNWLFNYQFTWAIEKSFAGVVKRAAYLSESEIAFEIFNKHYTNIGDCYLAFFPDLKKYTLNRLAALSENPGSVVLPER